jgi:putative acetyltransferase
VSRRTHGDAHKDGGATKIAVRRAAPDDAASIASIHEAAVSGERGRGDYSDEQLAAWAGAQAPEGLRKRIGPRLFLIAEDAHGPLGYAQLDISAGVLRSVYVAPRGQRQGVGALLVRAALEAAREAGLEGLELDSSLNAVLFYEALGFEALGTVEHRLRGGTLMTCAHMAQDLKGSAIPDQ